MPTPSFDDLVYTKQYNSRFGNEQENQENISCAIGLGQKYDIYN